MIRNYFKIAWRNLQKHKLQTGINILSLTIGTTCCLTILIYIYAQLGYDKHHDNAEAIYRVNTKIGVDFNSATNSAPVAFAIKEDFPEVTEACRLVYFGVESLIRAEKKDVGFYEPNGYLADATIFNVFSFPFLEGDPSKALVAPNTVVLSATLAAKMFGQSPAINRTIIRGSGENELTLTVTGVFDDRTGTKSHLKPSYLVTMNTPGQGEIVRNGQSYTGRNYVYSYIKLNTPESATKIQKALPSFLNTRVQQNNGDTDHTKEMTLQKVTDIHLYSKDLSNPIAPVSDSKYLYLLGTLALFILLVACVNFINLSTARANKRAKEIGVRKTIGADKKSLVIQFLGESVLLSLFAVLISIPISLAILPFINRIMGASLKISDAFHWQLILTIIVLGLLTGIIAGIYPALNLSSIKPVRVLKGNISLNSNGGILRKGLVVFQFIISIGLIASVCIVTQQVQFIQQKDMGYDAENLIAVKLDTQETSSRFPALKTAMSQITGVRSISASAFYPSQKIRSDFGIHPYGSDPSNSIGANGNYVRLDYFKTVGTQLLQGRPFKEGDTARIIVNKATIQELGLKLEEAVGSKMVIPSSNRNSEYFEIIGVTENFNYASVKEEIEPIVLFLSNFNEWMLIKTEMVDFQSILGQMESTWKEINTNTPFVYSFIDKEKEKLIAEEKRLSDISIVFTGLAILISCLGLFGLISFIVEQKKKEIGIRKVLGAKVSTVMKMLTKDFFILIIIALIIATPLVYLCMENWLQDYTYRISISWWVFLIAGTTTIGIALLTISIEAFKASTANPINSLRTE